VGDPARGGYAGECKPVTLARVRTMSTIASTVARWRRARPAVGGARCGGL